MQPSIPCPINEQKDPQILLDYVARSTTPIESALVETHAADCEPCQTFIAEQSMVWSALDRFEAPEVSLNFDRELYAKIAQQNREQWWKRVWRRVFEAGEPGSWRPAAAMSAALVVVFAVVLIQAPGAHHEVRSMTAPKSGIEQTAAIHDNDLESVELTLEDLEMLKVVGPQQPVI